MNSWLPGVVHRWPEWIAFWAAILSAEYALLAFWWTQGHPGLPSALVLDADGGDIVAWGVLERLTPGGIVVLAIVFVGVACGLVRTTRSRPVRTTGSQLTRATLVVAAWSVAVTLLIGVPDARLVALLAYLPAFVLGAPFDWPPVSFFDVITWPIINQLVCLVGGLVWAGAALVFTRHVRAACPGCGRGTEARAWTSAAAARQWGTAATWIAVVIPLVYATTRLAWAAGVPLGITESFLREGQEIGMWRAGAALAAVAISGAWLTVGLVRPWGEIVPRWIPVLRGRRVPPLVAIVPAAVMSCLFLSAGLDAVGAFMQHGFPDEGWGTTAPTLLWPAWGVSLGLATLGYYYRRRGRCERCGRGG
ncbi:MAG TPA: hypothetical protein VK912_04920 [Longimicrobiales bacterium]|nr:hypothetical protein [Longimicrobiales bacterium]